MIAFFVFVCALVAVSGQNVQFQSEKVVKRESVIPNNLFVGEFTVRLDHFRAQDNRTATFTYYANLEHFYAGSPFYIYLKHGGDYSTRWIEEGLMVDIARETHAALFTFDIRYFGSNTPTEDASFENMQFLTPEQILHDIAAFIESIHIQHHSDTSRVILWGSGYGATLATWARKKYPHLIDGTWSSSGVFEIDLASLNVYDSLGFIFYRTGDLQCRDTMQHAFEELDAMVLAGDGEAIQQRLGLCHPVDTNNLTHVSFLFERLVFLVMNYIENNHQFGLSNLCADLRAISDEPLDSFIRWLNYVYANEQCRDLSYESSAAINSNIAWNQPGTLSGRRQWAYLQCTQAGLFQITDSGTWLPNRIEFIFHVQECQDILGPNLVFDTLRTTGSPGLRNNFGSFDVSVDHVIYTNGYLDAWIYHGIIYSYAPDSIAITLDSYGRSADLTSISNTESIQLTEAKLTIVATIKLWSGY